VFTPTLKFGAKTIGKDFAASPSKARSSFEWPVVPLTNGLPAPTQAWQITGVALAWLKSTTTSHPAISLATSSP
jgi:hypothetical protein